MKLPCSSRFYRCPAPDASGLGVLGISFFKPGFLEAEEPGKVGCKPGMGRLFLPFNVGSTREISTDNLRE